MADDISKAWMTTYWHQSSKDPGTIATALSLSVWCCIRSHLPSQRAGHRKGCMEGGRQTCLVLGLTVCQTESSWRRTMSSKLLNKPCSRVSSLVSILLDLRSSFTQESIRSEMASYIALMEGLRCSHISTNCTAPSHCTCP